jgi:hypothetical protein
MNLVPLSSIHVRQDPTTGSVFQEIKDDVVTVTQVFRF